MLFVFYTHPYFKILRYPNPIRAVLTRLCERNADASGKNWGNWVEMIMTLGSSRATKNDLAGHKFDTFDRELYSKLFNIFSFLHKKHLNHIFDVFNLSAA